MGKGRRGGHAGRPTGSGTNFEKEFQDAQKERRHEYLQGFVNHSVGQTIKCSKCSADAKCYNAAVLVNFGVRSWWKCPVCGKEMVLEKSPEEMEQHYQDALATAYAQSFLGAEA